MFRSPIIVIVAIIGAIVSLTIFQQYREDFDHSGDPKLRALVDPVIYGATFSGVDHIADVTDRVCPFVTRSELDAALRTRTGPFGMTGGGTDRQSAYEFRAVRGFLEAVRLEVDFDWDRCSAAVHSEGI